jgi:ring-1,2-phenylacetyl-CoA epoxidase subunit PaaD
VVYSEVWTTERISEAGREMLQQAHLVPPPRGNLIELPTRASRTGRPFHTPQPITACPYCGSTDTSLENLFGPTPCRAICYCNACHQPFERFKSV